MTLRRVSSRQRLKWKDDFEGANVERTSFADDSDDDDDYECYEGCVAKKRHRRRHKRTKDESLPTLVVEEEVPSSDSALEALVDDAQLAILSFLTPADAQAVALTCRRLSRLIRQSPFVWNDWCRQKWPILNKTSSTLEWKSAHSHTDSHTDSHTALTSFLKMAVPTPTGIDTRVWWNSDTYQHQGNTRVQCTAPVGRGDRCIRANAPLPRPNRQDHHKDTSASGASPLWRSLCQMVVVPPDPTPFVAPFLCNDQWVLRPRLVSYYECSIAAVIHDDDDTEDEPATRHRPECVAVGLSLCGFHGQSRMPGWDALSFGYHGDDGGIFHANGGMLRPYGPSFGAGDTVGCGIDYRAGGIFFTLNGRFLGFAWQPLPACILQQDLYPTIGIDTHAPIDCNFGERPFVFNLSSMLPSSSTWSSSCR